MTPSPDDIGYGDKEPEAVVGRLDSITQTLDQIGKPVIGFVVEFKPLSADSITFVHPITGDCYDQSSWKALGKDDFSSGFDMDTTSSDEPYGGNLGMEIHWGGKENNKTYSYHLVDNKYSLSQSPVLDRNLVDRTTGKGIVVIAHESGLSSRDVLKLCLGQKAEDPRFLDQVQKGLTAASTPKSPTSG